MSETSEDYVVEYLRRSTIVLTSVTDDLNFLATIIRIAEAITCCFEGGGKLLIAGNGGCGFVARGIVGSNRHT